MYKSIFAKYISAFMAIIIISFLILMLIIVGVVNNYVTDTRRDLLSNVSKGAAEFLDARTESLTKTNIAEIVRNSQADVDSMLRTLAATDPDVSILLVDTYGNVVRMIPASGEPCESDAVVPQAVMSEVKNNVQRSEIESLTGVFDSPQFFHATPIMTADGYVCGIAFACADSDTQDALLGVMLKTIVVGSLWIILAALIAVYVVTDRVIGPLKSMSNMAKEFAEGNFAARVPVRGHDEVARLAESFNNMADSLSRLETMRNTFMANVSHDLRTPMTTISGFIDNILLGAIPPEKQNEYLMLIRSEVQRLARLVASLLDISRIQAGERKFVFKPFDVCEMARRILFSFEGKIESMHLDVVFDCDRERMPVLADHDAIYQILYNLCDNAVKFSREGGTLRVSINEIKEHHVQLSVYNEGEGIAAEDVPFVFERFYKGDKSRGLDKSGAGLGLFISKTIIDAHHERIWVSSEQGRFCEFKFTLPQAEP